MKFDKCKVMFDKSKVKFDKSKMKFDKSNVKLHLLPGVRWMEETTVPSPNACKASISTFLPLNQWWLIKQLMILVVVMLMLILMHVNADSSIYWCLIFISVFTDISGFVDERIKLPVAMTRRDEAPHATKRQTAKAKIKCIVVY